MIVDLESMPPLWSSVVLKDVAEVIMGQAPPGSSYNDNKQGVPLVAGAGDLGPIYPNPSKWTTKPTRLSQKGDIIYCVRATIGQMNFSDKEYCLGRGVAAIRSNEELIDPQYLYFWLLASQDYLVGLGTGSTFIQIRRQEVESAPVPLPPLPEQQRIVEILRQADELRRQQQAALEEAQKLIPAIFHDMFGDPNDWNDTIPLKNLVEFVGGGTPSRKIEEYFTGEIPWATSKDIKSRYLLDTEEHITQEAVKNSSTKLVPEGSILLVVKSKILIHSLPMGITTRPFCFGQDLKGLVPIQGNSPQFIVAALQAQTQYILSYSRGVNTEGLTLSALRTIPIPNISIAQHQEFAARVAVADRLIEQNATKLLQINLLFESLLTSAFAGTLTVQWRETKLVELTLAVANRDLLLGNSMKSLLALPTGSGKTESVLMYIFGHRKELKSTFSELQRRLLLSISKFSEIYFTPQSVKAQEGLHDLSLNAINRTFDLFEKLGLLVRVSLPVAPAGVEYAYFETFFRLPTPADQGLETASEIGV